MLVNNNLKKAINMFGNSDRESYLLNINPINAIPNYHLHYKQAKTENLFPIRMFLWSFNVFLLGSLIYLSLAYFHTDASAREMDKMFSKSDHCKSDKLIENQALMEMKIIEIIEKKIELYDADKVGLYDYAALYAGGKILSHPNTRPYPTNRSLMVFNYFGFTETSNPENILQKSTLPGDGFAFYGDKGTIIIKLMKPIQIGSITMEHSSLGLQTDARSAPKDFQVYGLLGNSQEIAIKLGQFQYNINGKPWQTFPTTIIDQLFEYIKLEILNNHGNVEYTCLYRFRVHSFN